MKVLQQVGDRAGGLAIWVGLVSLGIGLPLTFAPRGTAKVLGRGDRGPLARAIGVVDLVVGPALLLGRGQARWKLVWELLNAVGYAYVLAAGAPRPRRAVGGIVGMSVLTLTDSFLARRLRDLEGTRPRVGKELA